MTEKKSLSDEEVGIEYNNLIKELDKAIDAKKNKFYYPISDGKQPWPKDQGFE